jgi:capping protein (actin filament) muscle Z-line, beta
VDANDLLDAYRELYYQGGTSSVYLWDLEEGTGAGFAGAFLIKKSMTEVGHTCGCCALPTIKLRA